VIVGDPRRRRLAGIGGVGETLARDGGGVHTDFEWMGNAGGRRRRRRCDGGCCTHAYARESPEAMEMAAYRCKRRRADEIRVR
jgi:hypothetical protein